MLEGLAGAECDAKTVADLMREFQEVEGRICTLDWRRSAVEKEKAELLLLSVEAAEDATDQALEEMAHTIAALVEEHRAYLGRMDALRCRVIALLKPHAEETPGAQV